MAHLTNSYFPLNFLWNFHRRCLSTFSVPWCKKSKTAKNSNQGGRALSLVQLYWRALLPHNQSSLHSLIFFSNLWNKVYNKRVLYDLETKRTLKATKQPPSKISQTALEASFKPHLPHHQIEKLHVPVFHTELKDVLVTFAVRRMHMLSVTLKKRANAYEGKCSFARILAYFCSFQNKLCLSPPLQSSGWRRVRRVAGSMVWHIFGPQILISNFQKNPRALVSPHVCAESACPEWNIFRTAPSLRNADGLDQRRWFRFLPWQKRHWSESVRTKSLLVWRPGNRTMFSGGPKLSSISSPSSILLENHDLKSADSQVLDVRLCFNVPSRSASPRGRPRVHIHFDTFHGCYHRNDNAERTCEKKLFLVNFGHPDFLTFFESVLFGVMCSRCKPQTNVGKQLLRNLRKKRSFPTLACGLSDLQQNSDDFSPGSAFGRASIALTRRPAKAKPVRAGWSLPQKSVPAALSFAGWNVGTTIPTPRIWAEPLFISAIDVALQGPGFDGPALILG